MSWVGCFFLPWLLRQTLRRLAERVSLARAQTQLELTAAERAWLAEHPRIRVRISPSYPPFEFFRDGHYQGMAFDYLQLVEKRLGIKFQPVKGLRWTEVLERIRRQQAVDLILMITHSKERESFLIFTRDYISFPEVIYTRQGRQDIAGTKDLAGKIVAMERGYIEADLLKHEVSDVQLLETDSSEKALEAVATGKADAYLGNLAVASYLIDKRGFVDLKVAAPVRAKEDAYAMAVRKDWPQLAGLIDKALISITAEEHRQIRRKWLAIRYEQSIDWSLVWKWGGGIGGLLCLLLTVTAYWNRRLAHEVAVRRRTEIELEQAKETAEEASRSKSVFLSNMSHELRTPLTAILGYSLLLQRSKELPASLRPKVDTINRSGQHLSELINDVLEVSRIEAGRIDLNPVTFNLNTLLHDIEEMFHLRVEEKGLQLTFERADGVPDDLVCDKGKLRQILINLLGNAIKFTDKGGVRVRVEITPQNGGQLQVAVMDTGIGIAQAELARIFQPFEQTASGKGRGGTGLGLLISREYAQLMGGDLLVSSEPGKGSTFTLTCLVRVSGLPEASTASQQRTITGLDLGGQRKTILVAEDVADTRQLLKQLLAAPGVSILEAGNGQEALAMIALEQPDLVIMDMRMPVLDGYEAITRLKRQLQSSIPVIAISASALDSDRGAILETGADAFVHKPVNALELYQVVSRVLGVGCVYQGEDTPPLGQKV